MSWDPSVAENRCRRRVDEGDLVQLAPESELFRGLVVSVEHVAAVLLDGVGTGALMKHGGDRAEIGACPDPLAEVAVIEIVAKVAIDQVDVSTSSVAP